MMGEDSMAGGASMEDDQNYQFYKEYCRLYYANIILTNRLSQLLNEKKDLQFKLSRLEVSQQLLSPPFLMSSKLVISFVSSQIDKLTKKHSE